MSTNIQSEKYINLRYITQIINNFIDLFRLVIALFMINMLIALNRDITLDIRYIQAIWI